MAADRDEPLLLPLSAHLHLDRDEAHVVLVQPRQLGQTDARAVEQLEHGELASFPEPPRLRPPLRFGEQLLDLRAVQVLGERALQPGRARRLRGVQLQPARRVQEPVERPQRRESARGGALGEATLLHVSQPATDRQAVHAGEAPPATVIVGTERSEVFYVALVRLDGMGRVVALLFQEGDEVRDLGAHAVTSTPTPRAKMSMSWRARCTSSSRFFCLSFTGRSSGSTSPKFSFIGWKCAGSALCT